MRQNTNGMSKNLKSGKYFVNDLFMLRSDYWQHALYFIFTRYRPKF